MNLSIDYASFAFQNIDIIDGFSILLNGVDDFFIDAEMLLVVCGVSIYVRQIDDAFGFEIFLLPTTMSMRLALDKATLIR